MEELIYDMAKGYLIEQGYPAELRIRKYDPSFPIRGLAVDMDRGWLLKLSYIHQVGLRSAWEGRRRLSKSEVLTELGGSGHVSPDYRNSHMKPLLDLFSMSEACLLADTLDYLNENGIHHDRRAVVEDILSAINQVHISGRMHSAILQDPKTYLRPSPHLRETLQRFRDVGKKLFLCSNSNYEYVNGGMEFLLGSDWQSFFDVVIVSAGKPRFYTTDRSFREVSQTTGKIQWTEVTKLEKGKIYSHGSMEALTRMTGWSGPRVLYFGDQVFADLVGARRNQGWRTGAVIRELEQELKVQQSPQYRSHAHKVITVTELLRLVQQELENIRSDQSIKVKADEAADPNKSKDMLIRKYSLPQEDVKVSDALEKTLRQLQIEMSTMFNPQFGSVFRAEGDPSLFAFSLRRYCDIYMSKLSNLRHLSPMHRFYPQRGISMPHDPFIPSIIRPTFMSPDEEHVQPPAKQTKGQEQQP